MTQTIPAPLECPFRYPDDSLGANGLRQSSSRYGRGAALSGGTHEQILGDRGSLDLRNSDSADFVERAIGALSAELTSRMSDEDGM